ncbi:MAG: flagellar basal body-associated FliL family protein [Rhizobiales bacterium]|nr:flagellar basal body-associated FliL family protein [Hyphomicrobiales bacterium]
MADSSEKKAGMMPALLALVIVGAMGFGLGIGMRMAFDDPEAMAKAEAKASPSKEAKAEPHESKPKESKPGAEGEGGHPAEEAADEHKIEEPEADNLAELVATPIEPVITNLGNPKEVWIRLEGSILSRSDAEVAPKTLAAQAQQQILSYLRTIDSRQIEGASGLLHLNEDLNEVMKTFSGGQVRQLLISGLILE